MSETLHLLTLFAFTNDVVGHIITATKMAVNINGVQLIIARCSE
jgi:hypothetical protein